MLGFLYVFHIPIHEVTKKLRFLAITVLHPPLRASELSPLQGFLCVFFHNPIDELTKNYSFLPLPSYTPPLGQAGYPLDSIPICFSHSHRLSNEKVKISCHCRPTLPPQGRRAIPLLGFLYVFHIPIDELPNKLRFLAITVLHTPLGQAGYLLLEFLYAFCILIDGLLRKLWFLATPSYMLL